MARHLLKISDFSKEELLKIIDKAIEIKKNPEKYSSALKNKTLVMLFQKSSTRTRLSFEAGMTQLGGHAIFLDWRTTQFIMADLRDEAKCVNRYADIIMYRALKHDDLLRFVSVSTVPVINGLCEKYHPCQILGDIMTIKEHRGNLNGLKMTYIGIANNVSNSLTTACTRLGINFILCTPERDSGSLVQEVLDRANESGLYKEEKDPKKAVQGADIVYTDTWVNMEFFLDPKFKEEKERRIKKFMPYQVNKELMKGSKALFMHDLPAHRGYEVDDYMMDEYPHSIVFDQAENRLHVQKAIMLFLLGKL